MREHFPAETAPAALPSLTVGPEQHAPTAAHTHAEAAGHVSRLATPAAEQLNSAADRERAYLDRLIESSPQLTRLDSLATVVSRARTTRPEQGKGAAHHFIDTFEEVFKPSEIVEVAGPDGQPRRLRKFALASSDPNGQPLELGVAERDALFQLFARRAAPAPSAPEATAGRVATAQATRPEATAPVVPTPAPALREATAPAAPARTETRAVGEFLPFDEHNNLDLIARMGTKAKLRNGERTGNQDVVLARVAEGRSGIFDGAGGIDGDPAAVAASAADAVDNYWAERFMRGAMVFTSTEDARQAMRESFVTARKAVATHKQGATTANVLQFVSVNGVAHAVAGNSGNSLLFRWSPDKPNVWEPVTSDQSFPPKPSFLLNAMNAADPEAKQSQVDDEFLCFPVKKGERYIQLSDGVTGDMQDEKLSAAEIAQALQHHDIQEVVDAFLELQKKNDDASIVITEVAPSQLQQPPAASAETRPTVASPRSAAPAPTPAKVLAPVAARATGIRDRATAGITQAVDKLQETAQRVRPARRGDSSAPAGAPGASRGPGRGAVAAFKSAYRQARNQARKIARSKPVQNIRGAAGDTRFRR